MRNSTFCCNGYIDGFNGNNASPPDNSICAIEYLSGFQDGMKDSTLLGVNNMKPIQIIAANESAIVAALAAVFDENALLHAHNADLLAALDKILGSMTENGGLGGAYITVSGDTLRLARAAIARATS